MAVTDSPDFSVADCVMVDARVLGPNHYAFVAHRESELQKESYRCLVVEYRAGAWKRLSEWPWQAVAIEATGTASQPAFEILGRDGQVGTVGTPGTQEASVDPKRPVGPFRGLRLVQSRLLAFGMKREVFLRDDTATWVRLMAGLGPPAPAKKLTVAERMKLRLANVGGINAITADAGGQLVAVGMRGEIWTLARDVWTKVDSPTNVMLKDATSAADGSLYVCGQAGTLMHGSGSAWQMVTYVGPQKLDLCSACWFKGMLYLADGHALRVLRDGELVVIDHGTDDIVPCAVVTAGQEWMLSVAGQEVWETSDGKSWNCILG